MFECLVGYTPFYAEDPVTTCRKILNWPRFLEIPEETAVSVSEPCMRYVVVCFVVEAGLRECFVVGCVLWLPVLVLLLALLLLLLLSPSALQDFVRAYSESHKARKEPSLSFLGLLMKTLKIRDRDIDDFSISVTRSHISSPLHLFLDGFFPPPLAGF